MKETAKKVGYLKGLMEALPTDGSAISEKILPCIADLVSDLSDRIDALDEILADLNDYVESIDDDLSALEEGDGNFSNEEDEDFDDFDDEEDDDAPLHLVHHDDDAKDDEDEDIYASGLCPECGKLFFYSYETADDARFICPHCGKTVRPVEITPDNVPTAKPAED